MPDVATLVPVHSGYDVEIALHEGQKRIALLLADVVLPGISGTDAARRTVGIWPHIRVLFISGYGEAVLQQYDTRVTQTGFLGKPFTPAALLFNVKRLLDQPYASLGRRTVREENEFLAARPRVA